MIKIKKPFKDLNRGDEFCLWSHYGDKLMKLTNCSGKQKPDPNAYYISDDIRKDAVWTTGQNKGFCVYIPHDSWVYITIEKDRRINKERRKNGTS